MRIERTLHLLSMSLHWNISKYQHIVEDFGKLPKIAEAMEDVPHL